MNKAEQSARTKEDGHSAYSLRRKTIRPGSKRAECEKLGDWWTATAPLIDDKRAVSGREYFFEGVWIEECQYHR